jgi:hypothetical protein
MDRIADFLRRKRGIDDRSPVVDDDKLALATLCSMLSVAAARKLGGGPIPLDGSAG